MQEFRGGMRFVTAVLTFLILAIPLPARTAPFGDPYTEAYCPTVLSSCSIVSNASEDGSVQSGLELTSPAAGALPGDGSGYSDAGYRAVVVVGAGVQSIEVTVNAIVHRAEVAVSSPLPGLLPPPFALVQTYLYGRNLCSTSCVGHGIDRRVLLTTVNDPVARIEQLSQTFHILVRRECDCSDPLIPGSYFIEFVAESYLSWDGIVRAGRARASIDVTVESTSIVIHQVGAPT